MSRPVLLSLILLLVVLVAFTQPRNKYSGLDILSQIDIPTEIAGWKSMDVSDQVNLNDDRYNFISKIYARVFRNIYGEEILLLILDAGNFHNPKLCFAGSGYAVKELGTPTMKVHNTVFKANMLDMQKANQGIYLFYWMCIDKRIKDWTGQKITEIWASLLNRKKAGIMVRIEVPSKGRTSQQATKVVNEFIQSLSGTMDAEHLEYLFGK